MIRFFVLLVLAWAARAATGVPADLRATLASLRQHAHEHVESRGATPELTTAKHRLRDWIETNLATVGERGDEAALAQELNQALKDEGLTCTFYSAGSELKCPDGTLLGFVSDVRVSRESGYLIVETSVGILCGFDESAYLYDWAGGHWHRWWAGEQNDYSKERYKPLNITGIRISAPDEAQERLVLLLGNQPWCSSVWREVYYRLWQIGPEIEPRLLFLGSAYANVDEGIEGSVKPADAMVEFGVSSLDEEVFLRRAVRDVHIIDGNAQTIDPLALSPRGFAEEWLTTDWSLIAKWSAPSDQTMLQKWHRLLHSSSPHGKFVSPTMHCATRPDLWQVGIDLNAADHGGDSVRKYFLIRWKPPYRFSMVSIGRHQFAGCTEKDPAADESRTLFPGR